MYNVEIRIQGCSTVKRGGLYQACPCSQRVPGLSELLEQDIAVVFCSEWRLSWGGATDRATQRLA
jgi:hypothetical protein